MAQQNLTDALLRSLSCESGRKMMEVRDSGFPGLEVRVMAGGRKTWRLHYTRRSDGRRRVIKLGSYPALSLKDARTRAKRLQAEVEDDATHADPAGDRAAHRKAETFAEIAAEWLERHARPNKRERTVKGDEAMLARHVLPVIGAMKAVDITKRDMIRLFDGIMAKQDARGTRPATRARKLTHQPNRVFEVVRAIFRWSIGRDLLAVDPTFGLAPPIKKEQERERVLSAEEIRHLWAALDTAPVGRRYAKGLPRGASIVGEQDIPMTRATALAMKFSLVTAQRIGEVACIAMSELNLEGPSPMWTLPGKRSKNGHATRVPLSPLAVRLIGEARSLSPNSPWLFSNPKGTGSISEHAASKALGRARNALGIEDFRIHDLRRTAATHMAELGISPHTISLVLNHVSARRGTITGKVYVQYSYDREKREALGAWSSRLEEIMGA